MVKNDEYFMKLALKQARRAESIDEVPVGAVVVCDGRVVARGYNKKECKNDATLHAELIAIKAASKKLGRWRLSDCDIYVTLEPCPMCCGAIINSRMNRVIFGAYDPKSGCCETVLKLLSVPEFNHHPIIKGGVLLNECAEMLSDFFRKKRRIKQTSMGMDNKA